MSAAAPFSVGAKVSAKWDLKAFDKNSDPFDATVTAAYADGTYDLEYEDGSAQVGVPAFLVAKRTGRNESQAACCLCHNELTLEMDPDILICDGCGIKCHPTCCGAPPVDEDAPEDWLCDRCNELGLQAAKRQCKTYDCALCPNVGPGLFYRLPRELGPPTPWVHAACCWFMQGLWVDFPRVGARPPWGGGIVRGWEEAINSENSLLVSLTVACTICGKTDGAVVGCPVSDTSMLEVEDACVYTWYAKNACCRDLTGSLDPLVLQRAMDSGAVAAMLDVPCVRSMHVSCGYAAGLHSSFVLEDANPGCCNKKSSHILCDWHSRRRNALASILRNEKNAVRVKARVAEVQATTSHGTGRQAESTYTDEDCVLEVNPRVEWLLRLKLDDGDEDVGGADAAAHAAAAAPPSPPPPPSPPAIPVTAGASGVNVSPRTSTAAVAPPSTSAPPSPKPSRGVPAAACGNSGSGTPPFSSTVTAAAPIASFEQLPEKNQGKKRGASAAHAEEPAAPSTSAADSDSAGGRSALEPTAPEAAAAGKPAKKARVLPPAQPRTIAVEAALSSSSSSSVGPFAPSSDAGKGTADRTATGEGAGADDKRDRSTEMSGSQREVPIRAAPAAPSASKPPPLTVSVPPPVLGDVPVAAASSSAKTGAVAKQPAAAASAAPAPSKQKLVPLSKPSPSASSDPLTLPDGTRFTQIPRYNLLQATGSRPSVMARSLVENLGPGSGGSDGGGGGGVGSAGAPLLDAAMVERIKHRMHQVKIRRDVFNTLTDEKEARDANGEDDGESDTNAEERHAEYAEELASVPDVNSLKMCVDQLLAHFDDAAGAWRSNAARRDVVHRVAELVVSLSSLRGLPPARVADVRVLFGALADVLQDDGIFEALLCGALPALAVVLPAWDEFAGAENGARTAGPDSDASRA